MNISSGYAQYIRGVLYAPVVQRILKQIAASEQAGLLPARLMRIWFVCLFASVVAYGFRSLYQNVPVPRNGSTLLQNAPPSQPQPSPMPPAAVENVTPESRKWREYTGDFTDAQMSSFTRRFLKKESVIEWKQTDRPNFRVLVRAQGTFNQAKIIVNQIDHDGGILPGIDNYLYTSGGKDYQTAEKNLFMQPEYQNGYQIGHANMLESGTLEKWGFEHVILIAGPKKSDFVKTPALAGSALYTCYYNSLLLASAQKVESLTFPLIFKDRDSVYHRQIFRFSLKAIYDFIHDNPESPLRTISIDFRPTDREKLFTIFALLKAK